MRIKNIAIVSKDICIAYIFAIIMKEIEDFEDRDYYDFDRDHNMAINYSLKYDKLVYYDKNKYDIIRDRPSHISKRYYMISGINEVGLSDDYLAAFKAEGVKFDEIIFIDKGDEKISNKLMPFYNGFCGEMVYSILELSDEWKEWLEGR